MTVSRIEERIRREACEEKWTDQLASMLAGAGLLERARDMRARSVAAGVRGERLAEQLDA